MTSSVNKRLASTGIWTVVSVALVLLSILLLSTAKNPDGSHWLESSTVASTLATLGLIAAAVLPTVLGTRKDAAEVREQVQNSHMKPDGSPLNLRDDLDDKHDILVSGLKHLTTLVEGTIEDQRTSRESLSDLAKKVDLHGRAIRTLEGRHDD